MQTATALWERLDVPGHDAARLDPEPGGGWRLRGTAVFRHGGAPACLGYELTLDSDWETVAARIEGFLGRDAVGCRVERGAAGWMLNGAPQPGLGHLVDLDLGFTPATNLQQLRRVALGIGASASVPVAWLEAGSDRLVELEQHYRRLDRDRYEYAAPGPGYAGVLELAGNGFVRDYPGLWRMVEEG
jgi:uncharacterized protein